MSYRKPITVLHVPAVGEAKYLTIEPGLDEFQALVDGMIESLPSNQYHGYANEEGLLLGLDYNVRASTILDYDIVGDVVFTGGYDDEGEDLSVDPAQFEGWFA